MGETGRVSFPLPPRCQELEKIPGTVLWIVKYSTVQYSTVQCSTVQYSAVRYSTVQYSTVQSTVPTSRPLFLFILTLSEFCIFSIINKKYPPKKKKKKKKKK